MRKSVLYERHLNLKAKMTPFAGWQMPLYYSSILQEHHAVRENAGLFDLSHMGFMTVLGPDAESFLGFLSTNKIQGKAPHSATYTVFCESSGMTVDDLIVYKYSPTHFFLVVNASNRQKDLEHLKKYAGSYDVAITLHEDIGILALQGPKADSIAKKVFGEMILPKSMYFSEFPYEEEPLILSATGYTGEKGFEIYGKTHQILKLWGDCLKSGEEDGIQPCGLGARDTLRLEMGYALYGHELSDFIDPLESISAWTIKEEGRSFLGKEALLELKESGKKRYSYGIKLIGEGIARENTQVYLEDQQIGKVTSGTYSPTLKQAIALIMVEKPLSIGDHLFVEIRGRRSLAEVVSLPFIK